MLFRDGALFIIHSLEHLVLLLCLMSLKTFKILFICSLGCDSYKCYKYFWCDRELRLKKKIKPFVLRDSDPLPKIKFEVRKLTLIKYC